MFLCFQLQILVDCPTTRFVEPAHVITWSCRSTNTSNSDDDTRDPSTAENVSSDLGQIPLGIKYGDVLSVPWKIESTQKY